MDSLDSLPVPCAFAWISRLSDDHMYFIHNGTAFYRPIKPLPSTINSLLLFLSFLLSAIKSSVWNPSEWNWSSCSSFYRKSTTAIISPFLFYGGNGTFTRLFLRHVNCLPGQCIHNGSNKFVKAQGTYVFQLKFALVEIGVKTAAVHTLVQDYLFQADAELLQTFVHFPKMWVYLWRETSIHH